MFTALQMEQITKALSAKATKNKKKKRKVSFMSKVDSSEDNSSSSESESYMVYNTQVENSKFCTDSYTQQYAKITRGAHGAVPASHGGVPASHGGVPTSHGGVPTSHGAVPTHTLDQYENTQEKNYAVRTALPSTTRSTAKNTRPTTEMVVELITPRGTTRPIRCLLDTGTTCSIVLMDMVMLSQVRESKLTTWQTMSGSLVTDKVAQVVFKFPELSTNKPERNNETNSLFPGYRNNMFHSVNGYGNARLGQRIKTDRVANNEQFARH